MGKGEGGGGYAVDPWVAVVTQGVNMRNEGAGYAVDPWVAAVTQGSTGAIVRGCLRVRPDAA